MKAGLNYETMTMLLADFTTADHFGVGAIKATFNRAFAPRRGNVKDVTELVMVLNCKMAYHYERGDMRLARVYDKLWRDVDEWCRDETERRRIICAQRTKTTSNGRRGLRAPSL